MAGRVSWFQCRLTGMTTPHWRRNRNRVGSRFCDGGNLGEEGDNRQWLTFNGKRQTTG